MDLDLLSGAGVNRLLPVRHGFMLVNRHDTVVGASLDYYGEYFEEEVRLFRQCVRAGDVVIDAGANIGPHTLALTRIVGPQGRVIAYEPMQAMFQMLCANMALNSINWADCVHAALSDRDHTLSLCDMATDRPENFGAAELSALTGDLPVPALRLDGAFRHNRLRLIKIDVEGMEAEVLRGAGAVIERYRPALYVENDRVERSRELILLLRDLGYVCYWFLPSFHDPANFRGQSEPLFPPEFIDNGVRLFARGMGINLFCLPKTAGGRVSGLLEVADPDEHPLHRERNPRFRR